MTDNGCYLVHHNDLEMPQRTFEDYPLFPECEIRLEVVLLIIICDETTQIIHS